MIGNNFYYTIQDKSIVEKNVYNIADLDQVKLIGSANWVFDMAVKYYNKFEISYDDNMFILLKIKPSITEDKNILDKITNPMDTNFR